MDKQSDFTSFAAGKFASRRKGEAHIIISARMTVSQRDEVRARADQIGVPVSDLIMLGLAAVLAQPPGKELELVGA